MQTWILVSLFICGTIIMHSKGMEFDNHDLDFYIFKSFDGPVFDTDFNEPYETYGNSYSNEDNESSSSGSGENNEETDAGKKAIVNEGDATEIAAKNDSSSSGEVDDGDDESEESTEEKKPTVNKTLKTVDPEQKKLKESGDYVSPEDVEYRLTRQKRSKKPKSEEIDDDDDDDVNFDAYAKTYRDFVRQHFGKHDETDERNDTEGKDEVENDSSEEAAAAQAAKVNENTANQSEEDNDDESDEESDDAGDDPDYQRVKKLSEREAEESKRNPQFCKVVYKDDQECTICKNPKTHDTSESCSYSSSPAPKRYAFKRQKNYSSKDNNNNNEDNENDDIDNKKSKNHPEKKTVNDSEEDDEPKQKKTKSSKKKSQQNRKSSKNAEHNPVEEKLREYENPHYYGNYYNDRHTNSPLRSQTLSEADDDLSFRASEPYAASTSSDGNVDKVLESFKNRDWSKCKHKREKGITCYYCKDADGTTQEECMYSSDMDDDNIQSVNKKKHMDSVSGFKPANIPTSAQIPLKDESIYKNPSAILTTFNKNNQQERKLNRNQNFKINPTHNYEDSRNYASHLSNNQQNRRSFNVEAPITTLEYIEPKNTKTLKRMVTYKSHEDENDQKDPIENKSLFYSKVIHGFTI